MKKTKNTPLTDAQRQLVVGHMDFAAGLAQRFMGLALARGVPREDLLQECYYGLCIAASRYDAGQGVTFVTFAYNFCRREMEKAIRQQGFCGDTDEEEPECQEIADDQMYQREVRVLADQLLAKLNARERDIVERMCGMDGEPQGMKEIGRALQLNTARVREIYKRALGKMENQLALLV